MQVNKMTTAVLIPCYNEAATIGKVVGDFRKALPEARICVFDNNSKDDTAKLAREAGAEVFSEKIQGKGAVVRSMFSKIDADAYILADGDDQCPAESAPDLLAPILAGEADMVLGDRISNGAYAKENKRFGHEFGNYLVRFLVNKIFRGNLRDIMTGYRAFNRKFVKNFPIRRNGFEIETEMTLHALDNRFRIAQVPIVVRDRPAGSKSSMNTVRDGIKVLLTVFNMFKNYNPMAFFGLLALSFALLGLVVAIPVFWDFIFNDGYITHVPLAILASGIEVVAVITFFCGLILDTVADYNRRLYELRMVDYETKNGDL